MRESPRLSRGLSKRGFTMNHKGAKSTKFFVTFAGFALLCAKRFHFLRTLKQLRQRPAFSQLGDKQGQGHSPGNCGLQVDSFMIGMFVIVFDP